MNIKYFPFLLLIPMLLLAWCANAETLIAKNSHGQVMTIYDTPCENGKILKEVEKQLTEAGIAVPAMQSGEATLEDGKHSVCWVLSPNLQVVVVYENGMAVAIPMLDFMPATTF
jgi:hypothetical protein